MNRSDFPILARTIRGKRLVYLDSAATTQKPQAVLDAMHRYYTQQNANIHRGLHTLAEEATLAYEDAHKKVAGFIGAQSMEEIVFTRNTTESLNLLAYTLSRSLKKGDEILLTQMEHHSNLVPWQQLAKERGAVVKYLPINKTGELDDFSLLTKKTKIVSLAHVSNVLGSINPVQRVAKLAHEQGALCVVDAAQSVPHMPVNVQKLGADFIAFSGHKMLGPTGIGVMWGRKSLLEQLPPFLYGGDMISEVSFDQSTWNTLPWKFEAGTSAIAEGIGLGAAVEYLQKIGMDAVEEHEKKLVQYAFKQLEDVHIYGPPATRHASVLSFSVPGVHPHDLATLLDHEGIAIRGGNHCAMPLMSVLGVNGLARASFSIYNDKDDVDALALALKKARKVFA